MLLVNAVDTTLLWRFPCTIVRMIAGCRYSERCSCWRTFWLKTKDRSQSRSFSSLDKWVSSLLALSEQQVNNSTSSRLPRQKIDWMMRSIEMKHRLVSISPVHSFTHRCAQDISSWFDEETRDVKQAVDEATGLLLPHLPWVFNKKSFRKADIIPLWLGMWNRNN